MDQHHDIETERLILRPLSRNHAACLHQIYASPEAMRFWATPHHTTLGETEAMIGQLLDGPDCSWIICRRGENDAIGHIYYLGNPGPPGLGYILKSSHWGQGLMSEALRAVLRTGYEEMGLDRVELWIDSRNIASQRVAERAGFKRRSAFRQKYAHEAHSHEKLAYGLRVEEWRAHCESSQMATSAGAYSLHPVLAVPDVRATAHYYRDKLGFMINFLFGEPPTYGSVSWAEWTATGAQIGLSHRASPPPSDGISLYLNVGPAIDSLCARYEANGVEIADALATMPWGQREFAVRDCNGYVLRFGTPG